MPSTSAALCLRALVLCTIHTATTAIAVVPVDVIGTEALHSKISKVVSTLVSVP